MNRWSRAEHPDRYSSGNPNVEPKEENPDQNDKKKTEKNTLKDKLKEKNNEHTSPRERLAQLNGKMEKIKEEAGQAFPDMSSEKRQRLIEKLIKDKPLEEVLKETEGVNNTLRKAEELAKEPKSEGLSKGGQKSIEPYSEEDKKTSYSRSSGHSNADAVDKKGKKQDEAYNEARKKKYGKDGDPRRSKNQPNW